MHHPTDRIAHTTAFVTPVVEHWLERDIVLDKVTKKRKEKKANDLLTRLDPSLAMHQMDTEPCMSCLNEDKYTLGQKPSRANHLHETSQCTTM